MREIIPRSLVGADSSPSQPRIMRLGDSITVGLAYHGGMAKGISDVQWVGSQLAGAPMSSNADAPHEGHGGWSTVGILGHIDQWLADSKPSIVLLMIGTNDIGSKFPLDQVTTRLETICTKILASGAKLYLAMIPPLSQWKPEIDVAPYNQFIANLVDKLSKLGYTIKLVDVKWDSSDISSDHLHPNFKGYRKFADAYANAMGYSISRDATGKAYAKPSSSSIQLETVAIGAAVTFGIYKLFL